MSKYEVTDKVVYKTTHWMIEGDDGKEYRIRCIEGDMHDEWIIEEGMDEIDSDSELGQELIELCETHDDWEGDSDERTDDEAK